MIKCTCLYSIVCVLFFLSTENVIASEFFFDLNCSYKKKSVTYSTDIRIIKALGKKDRKYYYSGVFTEYNNSIREAQIHNEIGEKLYFSRRDKKNRAFVSWGMGFLGEKKIEGQVSNTFDFREITDKNKVEIYKKYEKTIQDFKKCDANRNKRTFKLEIERLAQKLAETSMRQVRITDTVFINSLKFLRKVQIHEYSRNYEYTLRKCPITGGHRLETGFLDSPYAGHNTPVFRDRVIGKCEILNVVNKNADTIGKISGNNTEFWEKLLVAASKSAVDALIRRFIRKR